MHQKSELERIFCDSGIEFKDNCRDGADSTPIEPDPVIARQRIKRFSIGKSRSYDMVTETEECPTEIRVSGLDRQRQIYNTRLPEFR